MSNYIAEYMRLHTQTHAHTHTHTHTLTYPVASAERGHKLPLTAIALSGENVAYTASVRFMSHTYLHVYYINQVLSALIAEVDVSTKYSLWCARKDF